MNNFPDIADLQTLLVACLGAVACALGGAFLVLRRLSLLADAISHSILLGIVLAWILVRDLGSPFLLLGATASGVFAVWLVEWFQQRAGIKEDAAMGLVFPALFSAAVVLISQLAHSVHLDTDAVINGRLELAFLDPLIVGNIPVGPRSAWILGGLVALQLILLAIFFHPLRIVWFDSAFAASIGISPVLFHWGVTTTASLTCVSAFDALGSILVVALMVGPASSALLWAKQLSGVLVLSVIFALISATLGFVTGAILDVSLSGMIAVCTGVVFGISWFAAPEDGLVAQWARKRRQILEFRIGLLLVHLSTHEDGPDSDEECRYDRLTSHLKWPETLVTDVTSDALRRELLIEEKGLLRCTPRGRDLAKHLADG
jgi:manganese/zinc/iron transport system permease protein